MSIANVVNWSVMVAGRKGAPTVKSEFQQALSPDQKDFLEWLVTPADVRLHEGDPTTERDYASANNMSRRVLTTWKQDIRFVKAWNERLQQLNVRPDRIQDVIDSMWEMARKGHQPSAKTYLEYVQQFLPPPEPPVETPLADMSDEELDALIASQAEDEKARRAGA